MTKVAGIDDEEFRTWLRSPLGRAVKGALKGSIAEFAGGSPEAYIAGVLGFVDFMHEIRFLTLNREQASLAYNGPAAHLAMVSDRLSSRFPCRTDHCIGPGDAVGWEYEVLTRCPRCKLLRFLDEAINTLDDVQGDEACLRETAKEIKHG